uniref:hypothetical protein n=1 Tax=Lysinibacillus sp. GbtcB16 TaxID=2824761 RepID=UPI001C300D23
HIIGLELGQLSYGSIGSKFEFYWAKWKAQTIVGKSWGDITCTAEDKTKKTKSPISQKDVHRRAKIGVQKICETNCI